MDFQLEVISKLLYQKIDELIIKEEFNGKRIVLFGLNSTSYCIEEYLKEKGYFVWAYIDNNKKRLKNIQNAYLPEELLKKHIENAVILIASKYYKEMETQLEKLGYRSEVQIIKVVDYYGIDTVMKHESQIMYSELGKEKIRNFQINILKYVKKLCIKHGLRYYLAAGTMLGAVRHKGFIPWDDDIDLLMPLQDAKELMEILQKDKRYVPFDIYRYPEQCYKYYFRVVDSQTCLKTWDYPFLTSGGISIDIFPLVGIPGNEGERFEYLNKIAELKTEYLTTYMKVNQNSSEMAKRREDIRYEIVYMIEKYDFDGSMYVGNPVSKYREKETLLRDVFETVIDMDFEGEQYIIPQKYDRYLKSLYGNYMELPPAEERVTTHNYRAYMK